MQASSTLPNRRILDKALCEFDNSDARRQPIQSYLSMILEIGTIMDLSQWSVTSVFRQNVYGFQSILSFSQQFKDAINIVKCTPGAKQQPRNKQLYNSSC
jgi:hypothetical protein